MYQYKILNIFQTPLLLKFTLPNVQNGINTNQNSYALIIGNELQSEHFQLKNRVSITNRKRYVEYPGLGEVFSIRSINYFRPVDRLTISFGYGAVRSVTPIDLNAVLQLSFHSSLEYIFSDWLCFQVYGQYISSPVNLVRSSPNRFSYMNPMYPQTFVGAEMYVKRKNIKFNAGPRMMFDSEFHRAPVKRYFNTKVTVGF